MLETLRADFMRTARAKGVKENKIVWKHAIRNALLPVVTTLGVNFGWALGGSVITETVFGMSGVGTLTLLSCTFKRRPACYGLRIVYVATLQYYYAYRGYFLCLHRSKN